MIVEYLIVNLVFEDFAVYIGVESFKDLICVVCNVCVEVNVVLSKLIIIFVKISDSDLEVFFNSNVNYIKCFINLEYLEIVLNIFVFEFVMLSVIIGVEIYLLFVDFLNVEEELVCFDKELVKW